MKINLINLLAGLKLDTVYLLSVFLSIETKVVTFVQSGKVDEVILLLMTIDKGLERTSEANLTNLVGNQSVPAVVFFLV